MEYLRQFNLISILIRLLLAMVLGGLIGLERETKRRPAGFRTHILICVGSALTTLTSQYLYLELHMYTDLARLGAQVIAGMGFIGAGTIIITKRNDVKGLTTAAGLWTTAIIGLCLGAAYFEGGIAATVAVLFIELVLKKFEYKYIRKYMQVIFYIEFRKKGTIKEISSIFENNKMTIVDMEMNKVNKLKKAFITIKVKNSKLIDNVIDEISVVENVEFVDTLTQ
ncbi:MAG: MgtC/SapB family protein [Sphaerochaetaceae bacterium]|nr:MgtC/SapB family protein [Sphaerochaetaceae bacterium]